MDRIHDTRPSSDKKWTRSTCIVRDLVTEDDGDTTDTVNGPRPLTDWPFVAELVRSHQQGVHKLNFCINRAVESVPPAGKELYGECMGVTVLSRNSIQVDWKQATATSSSDYIQDYY